MSAEFLGVVASSEKSPRKRGRRGEGGIEARLDAANLLLFARGLSLRRTLDRRDDKR